MRCTFSLFGHIEDVFFLQIKDLVLMVECKLVEFFVEFSFYNNVPEERNEDTQFDMTELK